MVSGAPMRLCSHGGPRLGRRALAALALLVLMPLSAAAATGLLVLHGNFERTWLQVESLDEKELRGVEAGARAVTIPMAEFIAAERGEAPASLPARTQEPAADKLVLWLAGDLRLAGEPVTLEGETVRWKSPALGVIALPLSSVRGAVRGSGTARLAAAGEDVVRLANGDTVRGAVAAMEGEQLTLQGKAGAQMVPWNAVVEMRLAETVGSWPTSAAAGGSFQVELADGTVWRAGTLSLAGDRVELTPMGGEAIGMPAAEVRAIEREGGSVRWLAREAPLRCEYTPYMTQSSNAPPAVTDGPTRVGAELFRTSLRVRPRSRLTYAIPPETRRFRTSYAQEKGGTLADVTLRIVADGKVLLEKTHVTSTSPASPVEVAVGGAKELVLEVDYGANFDVEDSLLWLDSAFVR